MGVSWTTLTTTTARPTDHVLIMGLGIVGNLAAQLFQSAGYNVTAVDPAESRRTIAQRSGIIDIRTACPVEDPTFALAIDCSGHEQAVLDACKVVRKGGEVVLLGVPWKKRTDVSAFDILHVVFHKYVVLRSGWEWSLPRTSRDFSPGSIFGNFASAMCWLATGRVKAQGLYKIARPSEAQAAYNDLLQQRGEHLSTVFDWTVE
jgi:threonine dehydrogenase-like Zn-dependent dehydrogenase